METEATAGTVLRFVGAKHGVGTTTLAAVTALGMAHAGTPVQLMDAVTDGDIAPLMGMVGNLGRVHENLEVVDAIDPAFEGVTIVDDGITDDGPGQRVIVVSSTYLAIRRLSQMERDPGDVFAVLRFPDSALGRSDIENIVEAPCTALPGSPNLFRRIDAGLVVLKPNPAWGGFAKAILASSNAAQAAVR